MTPQGSLCHSPQDWKQYKNLDGAEITGAEASLRLQLSTVWSGSAGLNIQSGKLPSLNDYIPLLPPPAVFSTIRFSKPDLLAELRIRGAAAQHQNSALADESETSAYAIIGVVVQSEVIDHVGVRADIENILDTDYADHLDYRRILHPGRTISLELTFVR
jgi:outer membrane receptor protein involved in Fe transport